MFCSFSVEPKNKKISYNRALCSPFSPNAFAQNVQNASIGNNNQETNSNLNNYVYDIDPIKKASQSLPSFTSSALNPSIHQVSGGTKKRKWTTEEDYLLSQAVNTYGVDSWNLVAQKIENRTGKQCRERWMSSISPTLIKDTWSPQEDLILIRKQSEFGNKWTLIHNFLPGRSNTAIKNRWKCLCRRSMSKHQRDFKQILSNTSSGISKTCSRATTKKVYSNNSLPKEQQKKAQNNIQEIIDSLFDDDCLNDLEATLSVNV
ncbi:hypothetical protein M9Y10_005436 [Tritrichomonas musculus]|uniref:Myb-like DNA-binding domain containing protein n=1 Tax=Tritrichomonas musculus TaxID=1915356 RepID=A0ABR2JL84_9EUKA